MWRKLLNTEKSTKNKENSQKLIKEHIFVIDSNSNILMGYSDVNFSHISLSLYKPLIGAGTLSIVKGLIKEISFNSGHYCPKIIHNLQTLKFFEGLGIPIRDDVKVTYYSGFTKVSTTIKEMRKAAALNEELAG